MSKEYNPPTGAPPNWGNEGGQQGYVPQAQPSYNTQQQDRGYGGYQQQQGYGGGYPPQQGYGGYPPQQQGYGGPPPGGYYQQQQPVYVQQQPQRDDSCLMACLGALCICCTLDMLF
ncbi:uncharacterized protein RJT21DRAFT_3527 [Scheffersomyces amazonensis]|uniref:uncharacterized protein n=1 Tax=Scheffersomyces amazonensis TaxID=1078765 RepID=UPI00315D2D13